MKNNLTQISTVKTKDKDKEVLPSVDLTGVKEIIILNNILPYYLLPKEELKNAQIDKIKKQFYISGTEFNYLNKTDIEKKLFSCINQSKINKNTIDLFTGIYKQFKEKSSNPIYLNLLIRILLKADIALILNFLANLLKEKKIIKDISESQILLHWLLETNFQAFMMKSTNYDKSKFMSRLYSSELIDENEIKNKIDLLNKLCNELLLEIFKNKIYKLDYLLTWAKYYNQLTLDNNKITNDLLKEFLFSILIEIDKIKIGKEITPDRIDSDSLYFMNILFELITYFKYIPVKNDKEVIIKLKEDSSIIDEISSSFRTLLINDDTKNETISQPLKTKWKYYTFLKKLFLYFVPLWNKILKEDNDLFGKYIENKKNLNAYISETEILFYQFDDVKELNVDPQKNIANKGIPAIYILYNCFTVLFIYGGDKEEMKEIINVFRHFLIFLIISSCTLSTTIDKKKRKWPKAEDYQMVQITVKNILYNSFHFFVTNIKRYDEILESNKSLSETDKNYYLYIKLLLYEAFGHLIKTLNGLYRVTRKEVEKKSNKKGFKNILSKMKGLFSDSEGVKASGPYAIMEKLYENLGLDIDSSYLNKIPNIEFKSKDVKNTALNPKIEECIKSLIKDPKIKNFFNAISFPSKDGDDLDKNKIYPFVDCIKKRALLLNWFVPCYDNLPNIVCDINDSKYYIIKKLLLVCDYFRVSPYDETLNKNIVAFNSDINKKLFLNIKKEDIEEKAKIYKYVKIKKRLFSFLGIWSTKEFFYNKDKYELKYKLINHLTEDYTRVLFKPILNIDYYLPIFSKFNYDNLFRKNENKKEIYHLTDLSFIVKEHKKPLIEDDDQKEEKEEKEEKKEEKINNKDVEKKTEENRTNDNQQHEFNILYDLKMRYYKDLNNITMDKDKMNNDLNQELFGEYIKQRFSSNSSQIIQVDSCLIKPTFHVNGILFSNSGGIGFYGFNKIHKENDEEFDVDRNSCFGSIFRLQNSKYGHYYLKIPYYNIEFVLKRRYFYKRNVIEIFTVNKKSYLFRIDESKYRAFFENIKNNMKQDIEDICIEYSKYDEKIGFYNKKTGFISKNKFILLPQTHKDMNLKNIYEKWCKWKISSLKMLMMINIYANRTYNDLNQYPVFPWIITDYTSEELPALKDDNDNESNKKLIRPFGTPMPMMDLTDGAQIRKENYIEHLKSSDEDEEKEENFDRYHSHYSTSLYVTYYLVRIFPYSSMRIEIQGKNFDDPNRLFNSLPASFINAISQKADLRELIPELYCIPELFYNSNELNLGSVDVNDKEQLVGDIALPPWAKGSGYLFINKHRELLESPAISDKINEWINIIFGSKQKGKEAKKIYNLFMKESYEDYDDEYKKKSFEDKIYYLKLVEFGVTPNQIFKNDVNKRNPYTELKDQKQLLPNMTEYLKNYKNMTEGEIDLAKELVIEPCYTLYDPPYKLSYCELSKDKCRIFAITQEKIKVFKRIVEKIQNKKTTPVPGLNAASTQNDNTNANDNKEQSENKEETKDIIKLKVDPKREFKINNSRYRLDFNHSPMIFYNDGKNVALGGYYNGNILVQNLEETTDDKKTKVKSTVIHSTNENSPIVQMIINNSDNFVICGNTLGTVFIFAINQSNKSEWTLCKTLYDHHSEIVSISFNENLNIFISCSKDGYCMLYTMPQCHLINSFRIIDKSFSNEDKESNNKIYYPNLSIISNSPLPCIIFYIESRQSLSVFSINGHFIKEAKLDFRIIPNGIKKFTDRQFKDYLLIYNSNSNSIEVYNIIELTSVLSLPVIGHTFIDFMVGKQLDHIWILVKNKGKNEVKNEKNTYQILIMRNPNCEIDWK
jgi:hypothetical protein